MRYPVATDQKLETLALKLGRTKKLVIIQMVDYFHRSKKDPLDFNDELLKKELVNGNNRIIAFIKKQESDFLFPIFNTTGELITIAKQHTTHFKTISGHLVEEAKKTALVSSHIGSIEKSMTKILTQMEEKAALKSSFKKILEYYINQRETLGWPTSNVKKEELQTHVRQSLQNL